MLLLQSGALLFHPFWHMLICKERRRTLHLQSQSVVPMDHATKVYGFYTLAMCTTWPWLFAWVGMVSSSVSARIKREESWTTRCNHATTAATPRLTSIYVAGKYAQVCTKVSQCSSTLHSYLSPFEYSLMHTTFAYFLVCSGFSLALGIFNQMRLRVKFD